MYIHSCSRVFYSAKPYKLWKYSKIAPKNIDVKGTF